MISDEAERIFPALLAGLHHTHDPRQRVPVTVIQNNDSGFTGGVLGLPQFESIIILRDYVEQLTSDQLAIVLGRRMIAIESGSRTRGIVVAVLWIVTGFCVSAALPGAGVTSIAELVTTSMGFTVWTFLGLLTLPTISRQSSYAIDSERSKADHHLLGTPHE